MYCRPEKEKKPKRGDLFKKDKLLVVMVGNR
jgi:hypothetical protein